MTCLICALFLWIWMLILAYISLSWNQLAKQHCMYSLSHLKNDNDVSQWAWPRINAIKQSFMHNTGISFRNIWQNTQVHYRVMCATTSIFLWNRRWRHGRSRGETKCTTAACRCLWCPTETGQIYTSGNETIWF